MSMYNILFKTYANYSHLVFSFNEPKQQKSASKQANNNNNGNRSSSSTILIHNNYIF